MITKEEEAIELFSRLKTMKNVPADVMEAHNIAIDAIKNKPKWIPVSERQPKEIKAYIATLDYEEYGLAVGQRYYHGEQIGWDDKHVIAWMPMPKPYEPQESEEGHWIRTTDKAGYLVWECNKCGWQQKLYTHFCPDCGKKMVALQEKKCADCKHNDELSLDCARCDDSCSMFDL